MRKKTLMIVFNNVSLSYNKNFNILSNINLAIGNGQKVLFVGDEHSGMQSVLHIISKQQKQSSGSVLLLGKDVKDVNFANELSLGYLSLHSPFFVNKSVYKNLEYVLKIRGASKQEIDSKIEYIATEFNVAELLKKKFCKLTQTEKLLVQIARLSLRQLDMLLVEDIFVKEHIHLHKNEGKKHKANEDSKFLQKKELFSFEQKTLIAKNILKLCNKNSSATIIVATNQKDLFSGFADIVVNFEYGTIVE